MMILNEVSKKYDDGPLVLDRVSLSLSDVGLYALYGESGCGKTTFLNMIAGFLTFDGTIDIDGTVFKERITYPLGQEPAYITQDPFFADFLTVIENLELVGATREECLRVIRRLKLEGTERLPASAISGGEKQRLALARALLKGSRIFLLDEPTASLDEKNKHIVFEILEDLKKDCLILCATHDPELAHYADSVFALSKEKGMMIEQKASSAQGSEKEKEAYGTGDENKTQRMSMIPVLLKWLLSGRREKMASIGFMIFLVTSFLLIAFSDTQSHKTAETEKYLFRLNSLKVQLGNNLTWKEMEEAGDPRIREVVLDYSYSCPRMGPQNNEEDSSFTEYEIGFDTMIPLLPNDPKCFGLLDKIAYGTYFTSSNQVIMSHEMASKLSGGHDEKMLGTIMKKYLYGIGSVDLEVVGILGPLDDYERTYLQNISENVSNRKPYVEETNESLFFANAALVASLEDDASFYIDSYRRYLLFFDSYDEMASFQNQFEQKRKDDLNVTTIHSVGITHDDYMVLCVILIPLAFIMSLLSALFFVELKRAEFAYNNRFVAVLEYCGYTKKRIVNSIAVLTLAEVFVYLMVSLGLAGIISAVVNHVNETKWYFDMRLFSWNPYLVISCSVTILMISGFYAFYKLSTVRTVSWYDQTISSRDIL